MLATLASDMDMQARATYYVAIARHEQAWGVPAPEPTEPGTKGSPASRPPTATTWRTSDQP